MRPQINVYVSSTHAEFETAEESGALQKRTLIGSEEVYNQGREITLRKQGKLNDKKKKNGKDWETKSRVTIRSGIGKFLKKKKQSDYDEFSDHDNNSFSNLDFSVGGD